MVALRNAEELYQDMQNQTFSGVYWAGVHTTTICC